MLVTMNAAAMTLVSRVMRFAEPRPPNTCVEPAPSEPAIESHPDIPVVLHQDHGDQEQTVDDVENVNNRVKHGAL